MIDLKMKYGEFKGNDDLNEFHINKPKNKFVTFKSSMRDGGRADIHD